MTEAKSGNSEGFTHVDGRISVRSNGGRLLRRIRTRFGRRKLDGTQLGGKAGEMTTQSLPHFWRDIVVVLAAKLVLLTCLYVAFFSPSHRPPADTAAVTARLIGHS
jgi:hypothetical protein